MANSSTGRRLVKMGASVLRHVALKHKCRQLIVATSGKTLKYGETASTTKRFKQDITIDFVQV